MKKIIIEGTKIGDWNVFEEVPKPLHLKNKGIYHRCVCKCGTEKVVYKSRLLSNRTQQCSNCSRFVHGMWGTHLYNIWNNMKKKNSAS